MNIAFLNRYQNKVERGAEVFVKELVKHLSANHRVEVLAGSDADSLSKVIKGKYDIVIPINGGLQSLKVSLGRIFGGYKVLISGHSGVGRDDLWNIAIAKPDLFVALTDHMTKWAKKWAWGTKVVKIPNGIDLDKFTPLGQKVKIDRQRPVILCVGALVWYKYHEKAIRAVSKLAKGSLLIVGQGDREKEINTLGRKLLGDRFKISQYKYEDMPKVYRSCDLFTLPSWDREAFGLVYLEAMASGLGVVAPNDLSRSEIIGEGGILVDVSDPKKYSDAIKKALKVDWGKKTNSQAEKFSWDKIARLYEKEFEKLI